MYRTHNPFFFFLGGQTPVGCTGTTNNTRSTVILTAMEAPTEKTVVVTREDLVTSVHAQRTGGGVAHVQFPEVAPYAAVHCYYTGAAISIRRKQRTNSLMAGYELHVIGDGVVIYSTQVETMS